MIAEMRSTRLPPLWHHVPWVPLLQGLLRALLTGLLRALLPGLLRALLPGLWRVSWLHTVRGRTAYQAGVPDKSQPLQPQGLPFIGYGFTFNHYDSQAATGTPGRSAGAGNPDDSTAQESGMSHGCMVD